MKAILVSMLLMVFNLQDPGFREQQMQYERVRKAYDYFTQHHRRLPFTMQENGRYRFEQAEGAEMRNIIFQPV